MMDNELHAIERGKIMDKRQAKGLFWDRAWKLVEGCTKVSLGCDNCWSEVETVMRANHPHVGIAGRAASVLERDGSFSGGILCREDNLDLPLRTRKPTVWAIWNDLFHEDVSNDFRDRAYAVMTLCPQHIFLVLTKRAERMAEYWLSHCGIRNRTGGIDMIAFELDASLWEKSTISTERNGGFGNVWHGVTVENQAMADERIPHLLRVPGKRFLSIEPMLGPVDLSRIHTVGKTLGGAHFEAWESCLDGFTYDFLGDGPPLETDAVIRAVLLGGESGKNARPMNPAWVRSVRDQCAAAGVPYYHKQNGEWASVSEVEGSGEHYHFPTGETVRRVGKKKAGRLLDGRLHNDLPYGVKP